MTGMRHEQTTYGQTTLDNMLGCGPEFDPRFVAYTVAMDNHEPYPLVVETGRLVEYDWPDETSGQPRFLRPVTDSKIEDESVFVIDDGKVAYPYYGGSHNPGKPSPLYPEGREPMEILYPFPVNPHGLTRLDNGRVIDFTTWMLGPRKCYHVKIIRGS